jgi:hypothetical protein
MNVAWRPQAALAWCHSRDTLGGAALAHQVHVWYLKENGWLQRLENGMLAITASGVDRALDDAAPVTPSQPLLRAVE